MISMVNLEHINQLWNEIVIAHEESEDVLAVKDFLSKSSDGTIFRQLSKQNHRTSCSLSDVTLSKFSKPDDTKEELLRELKSIIHDNYKLTRRVLANASSSARLEIAFRWYSHQRRHDPLIGSSSSGLNFSGHSIKQRHTEKRDDDGLVHVPEMYPLFGSVDPLGSSQSHRGGSSSSRRYRVSCKSAGSGTVGTVLARSAVQLGFAFLRRAWRCGDSEDKDLCLDLLWDALEAFRELPPATLFTAPSSTLQPISVADRRLPDAEEQMSGTGDIWNEVADRCYAFLTNVVKNQDSHHPVPEEARKVALALLLELGVQSGRLSLILNQCLLLLQLRWTAKASPNHLTNAPLIPLLRRFEQMVETNQASDPYASGFPSTPCEALLGFMKLPINQDHIDVDLKQAAVLILCYLASISMARRNPSLSPLNEPSATFRHDVCLAKLSPITPDTPVSSHKETPEATHSFEKFFAWNSLLDLGVLCGSNNPSSLNDVSIKKVVASSEALYILTKSGLVHCVPFTKESVVELVPHHTTRVNARIPTKETTGSGGTSTPPSIADISAFPGSCEVLAVSESGSLYSWTSGHGKSGQGCFSSKERPSLVESVTRRVVSAVCGPNHCLCVTEDGCLLSCGSNTAGQLGLGDRQHRAIPEMVQIPSKGTVLRAAANIDQSICLLDNGRVYTWGCSPSLCREHTANLAPVEVQPLASKQVGQIAAGDGFFAALTAKGEIYTWRNVCVKCTAPQPILVASNGKQIVAINKDLYYLDHNGHLLDRNNRPVFPTMNAEDLTGFVVLPKMSSVLLWRAQPPPQEPLLSPFTVEVSVEVIQLLTDLMATVLTTGGVSSVPDPPSGSTAPPSATLGAPVLPTSVSSPLHSPVLGQTAGSSPLPSAMLNQDAECICVASLRLIGVQLMVASRRHLRLPNRLTLALKQQLVVLACGGISGYSSIQKASQLCLKWGWPLLFPTAEEHLLTLYETLTNPPGTGQSSGLSASPGAPSQGPSSSRYSFMTNLLLTSLNQEPDILQLMEGTRRRQADIENEKGSVDREKFDEESFLCRLLHDIFSNLRHRLVLIGQCGSSGPNDTGLEAWDSNHHTMHMVTLLTNFHKLLFSRLVTPPRQSQEKHHNEMSRYLTILQSYCKHLAGECSESLQLAWEVLRSTGQSSKPTLQLLYTSALSHLLSDLLLGLHWLFTSNQKAGLVNDVLILDVLRKDVTQPLENLLPLMDKLNRLCTNIVVSDRENSALPGWIVNTYTRYLESESRNLPVIRARDLANQVRGGNCWVVVHSRVYDLFRLKSVGQSVLRELVKYRGTDASDCFDKLLDQEECWKELVPCCIGDFAKEEGPVECETDASLYDLECLLASVLVLPVSHLLLRCPRTEHGDDYLSTRLPSPLRQQGFRLPSTPPRQEEKECDEVERGQDMSGESLEEAFLSQLSRIERTRRNDLVAPLLSVVHQEMKRQGLHLSLVEGRSEHPLEVTTRLVLAVLLRQHDLVWEMVPQDGVKDGPSLDEQSRGGPALQAVCRTLTNIKREIIKRHQQNQGSYKDICAPIVERCHFLLDEVEPAHCRPADMTPPLTRASRWQNAISKVIMEQQRKKALAMGTAVKTSSEETPLELTGWDLLFKTLTHGPSKRWLFDRLQGCVDNSLIDAISTFLLNKEPVDLSTFRSIINHQRSEADICVTLVERLVCLLKQENLLGTVRCALLSFLSPTGPLGGHASPSMSQLGPDRVPTESLAVHGFSNHRGDTNPFTTPTTVDKDTSRRLCSALQSLIGWALDQLATSVVASQVLLKSADSMPDQTFGNITKINNAKIVVPVGHLPFSRLQFYLLHLVVMGLDSPFIDQIFQCGILGVVQSLLKLTGVENTLPLWLQELASDPSGMEAVSGGYRGHEGVYQVVEEGPTSRAGGGGWLAGRDGALVCGGGDAEEREAGEKTGEGPTGSDLVAKMTWNTWVQRGADWKWDDQDGPAPGLGRIVSEVAQDGWVRVRWQHGSTNSYRMGREGYYDLQLADPTAVAAMNGRDTSTSQDQADSNLHQSARGLNNTSVGEAGVRGGARRTPAPNHIGGDSSGPTGKPGLLDTDEEHLEDKRTCGWKYPCCQDPSSILRHACLQTLKVAYLSASSHPHSLSSCSWRKLSTLLLKITREAMQQTSKKDSSNTDVKTSSSVPFQFYRGQWNIWSNSHFILRMVNQETVAKAVTSPLWIDLLLGRIEITWKPKPTIGDEDSDAQPASHVLTKREFSERILQCRLLCQLLVHTEPSEAIGKRIWTLLDSALKNHYTSLYLTKSGCHLADCPPIGLTAPASSALLQETILMVRCLCQTQTWWDSVFRPSLQARLTLLHSPPSYQEPPLSNAISLCALLGGIEDRPYPGSGVLLADTKACQKTMGLVERVRCGAQSQVHLVVRHLSSCDSGSPIGSNKRSEAMLGAESNRHMMKLTSTKCPINQVNQVALFDFPFDKLKDLTKEETALWGKFLVDSIVTCFSDSKSKSGKLPASKDDDSWDTTVSLDLIRRSYQIRAAFAFCSRVPNLKPFLFYPEVTPQVEEAQTEEAPEDIEREEARSDVDDDTEGDKNENDEASVAAFAGEDPTIPLADAATPDELSRDPSMATLHQPEVHTTRSIMHRLIKTALEPSPLRPEFTEQEILRTCHFLEEYLSLWSVHKLPLEPLSSEGNTDESDSETDLESNPETQGAPGPSRKKTKTSSSKTDPSTGRLSSVNQPALLATGETLSDSDSDSTLAIGEDNLIGATSQPKASESHSSVRPLPLVLERIVEMGFSRNQVVSAASQLMGIGSSSLLSMSPSASLGIPSPELIVSKLCESGGLGSVQDGEDVESESEQDDWISQMISNMRSATRFAGRESRNHWRGEVLEAGEYAESSCVGETGQSEGEAAHSDDNEDEDSTDWDTTDHWATSTEESAGDEENGDDLRSSWFTQQPSEESDGRQIRVDNQVKCIKAYKLIKKGDVGVVETVLVSRGGSKPEIRVHWSQSKTSYWIPSSHLIVMETDTVRAAQIPVQGEVPRREASRGVGRRRISRYGGEDGVCVGDRVRVVADHLDNMTPRMGWGMITCMSVGIVREILPCSGSLLAQLLSTQTSSTTPVPSSEADTPVPDTDVDSAHPLGATAAVPSVEATGAQNTDCKTEVTECGATCKEDTPPVPNMKPVSEGNTSMSLVVVDFPERPNWLGFIDEVQALPAVHDTTFCDSCLMKPIMGPLFYCPRCPDMELCIGCYQRVGHQHAHQFNIYVRPDSAPEPAEFGGISGSYSATKGTQKESEDDPIESLEASADKESASAVVALRGDGGWPNQAWRGTGGRHWIRVILKEGVVINRLRVQVSKKDPSFIPERIFVRGGPSWSHTVNLATVRVRDRAMESTARHNTSGPIWVTLLEDMHIYVRHLEVTLVGGSSIESVQDDVCLWGLHLDTRFQPRGEDGRRQNTKKTTKGCTNKRKDKPGTRLGREKKIPSPMETSYPFLVSDSEEPCDINLSLVTGQRRRRVHHKAFSASSTKDRHKHGSFQASGSGIPSHRTKESSQNDNTSRLMMTQWQRERRRLLGIDSQSEVSDHEDTCPDNPPEALQTPEQATSLSAGEEGGVESGPLLPSLTGDDIVSESEDVGEPPSVASLPPGHPRVLVWGLNDKEQLGGPKGSKVKLAVLNTRLSALNVVQLAGGSKSLFCVTQEGRVYACGDSANGRLGLGQTTKNITIPTLITGLSQYIVEKVAVHSGGRHAMALTIDGRLLSWGEGDDGKLGHNSRLNVTRPRVIEALRGRRIVDMACGSSHSAAITAAGELFTWGLGEYGRLGHGDFVTLLKPKQVRGTLSGYRVMQVACGSRDAQTLALTEDNQVWSWGDGDFGKLGRGGSEGCSVPQSVDRLAGLGVIQVECGAQFSLARTDKGEVYTWGKGDYFRLGHGSDGHVRKPQLVEGLKSKKIVHVAVGALHCLAVSSDGKVFAWGDNDHGQQGCGSTEVNKIPQVVQGLENYRIVRVACGSSHSVAYTAPLGATGGVGSGGVRTPHHNRITASSTMALGGPANFTPVPFQLGNDPMGVTHLLDLETSLSSKTGMSSTHATDQSSKTADNDILSRPSLTKIITQHRGLRIKRDVGKRIIQALQISTARLAMTRVLMELSTVPGPSPSTVEEGGDTTTAESMVTDTEASRASSAMPEEDVASSQRRDMDGLHLDEVILEESVTPRPPAHVCIPVQVSQRTLLGSHAPHYSLPSLTWLTPTTLLRCLDLIKLALAHRVPVWEGALSPGALALSTRLTDKILAGANLHSSGTESLINTEIGAIHGEKNGSLSLAGQLVVHIVHLLLCHAETLSTVRPVDKDHLIRLVLSTCVMELASSGDESGSSFVFPEVSGASSASKAATPKPIMQESPHPYLDNADLKGCVRIPGAEMLRIEFDSQCATERHHDRLTLLDSGGRVVVQRSGREAQIWSPEVKIRGSEVHWRFVSDASVTAWGWRFTVHPIMQTTYPQAQSLSDTAIIARPCLPAVKMFLDLELDRFATHSLAARLARSLSTTAGLLGCSSSPPPGQGGTSKDRIWALVRLHRLLHSPQFDLISRTVALVERNSGNDRVNTQISTSSSDTNTLKEEMSQDDRILTETSLTALIRTLPTILQRQYSYEDPLIRSGKQLLHSAFFKMLARLACDIQLDNLLVICDSSHWLWFRRFCTTWRTARALLTRQPLPPSFLDQLKDKFSEMYDFSGDQPSSEGTPLLGAMAEENEESGNTESFAETSLESAIASSTRVVTHKGVPDYADPRMFGVEEDEQIITWLKIRPDDWKMCWPGGSGQIWGWGHNHRGQLGGVDGSKVKIPVPCDHLSALRPVQLIGGEQSLFIVTVDGRVYATGYGACGRLGIGSNESVMAPTCLDALQHVNVVKVSVNSGGKHCLALTSGGQVYSWGEGEDGKLGHGCPKDTIERPKLIEAFKGVEIVDIAAGGSHSAAISAQGFLYTWGKGRYGRLGHGDGEEQSQPKLVEALRSHRVTYVACGSGDAQTLCITADDAVWSWGDGDYGKLGRGGSEVCKVPQKIDGLQGVVKVECGSQFSIALTRSGTVFTWGKGDYHRLGHGQDEHVRKPKRVQGLQGKTVIDITCGSLHCIACTDSGDVYAWGDNDEGQLGDGSTNAISRPRVIQALQGKRVNRVACGSAHSLAWCCPKPCAVLSSASSSRPAVVTGVVKPVNSQRSEALPAGDMPIELGRLKDKPRLAIRNRFLLLHHFSDLFTAQLPAMAIDHPLIKNNIRRILLPNSKEAALRICIQTSMQRNRQHGPEIKVNRLQASAGTPAGVMMTELGRPALRGGAGSSQFRGQLGLDLELETMTQRLIDPTKSVFAQIASRLLEVSPSGRSVNEVDLTVPPPDHFFLPHRVWKVKLIGESVDDCGGGYSESIAEMCDELQNGFLPFLIPAPSGDCFVLKPEIVRSDWLLFLGVLMGIAVRTGHPLSLHIHEVVWKVIGGQDITLADVAVLNSEFLPSMLSIREMNDEELTKSELPYYLQSISGSEVRLPGASGTPVFIGPDNKENYLKAAMNYKLHEFDDTAKLVIRGMSHVIPMPYLTLFMASEIESMVCGNREIPVTFLRSIATYKGVEVNDTLIQSFWEVMEEMSNRERSLFLRFVWGRTRLPRNIADMRGRDFVIQVLDKYTPPDHFLPEAYTCFFLLKMPRYSCKPVLREKLLYAIHFCKSIDIDDYARIALSEDAPLGGETGPSNPVHDANNTWGSEGERHAVNVPSSVTGGVPPPSAPIAVPQLGATSRTNREDTTSTSEPGGSLLRELWLRGVVRSLPQTASTPADPPPELVVPSSSTEVSVMRHGAANWSASCSLSTGGESCGDLTEELGATADSLSQMNWRGIEGRSRRLSSEGMSRSRRYEWMSPGATAESDGEDERLANLMHQSEDEYDDLELDTRRRMSTIIRIRDYISHRFDKPLEDSDDET